MKQSFMLCSLALVIVFTNCKKKEDPAPTPTPVVITPVPNSGTGNSTRTEYAFFRGLINGTSADYTVYLDDNTQYTSYLSNGSEINSTGGPSRFEYGHSVMTINSDYGITLTLGVLETMGYPTTNQFFNFFKKGKFSLVADRTNGAQVSLTKKSGSNIKIYHNTVQPLNDSAYVEITKLTQGEELGEPVMYYEAKLNATLLEISTNEKITIRNAIMKGSFTSEYIQD